MIQILFPWGSAVSLYIPISGEGGTAIYIFDSENGAVFAENGEVLGVLRTYTRAE